MTTPTQGGSAAASPPATYPHLSLGVPVELEPQRSRLVEALIAGREDLYLRSAPFHAAIDALLAGLPTVVTQLVDAAEARLELDRRQSAELARHRGTGIAGLERLVEDRDLVCLYLADDGWRWRYLVSGVAGFAVITADGGQGYSRRQDAIAGAARVVGVDAELLEQTSTGELEVVGRSAGPDDHARPVALLIQGAA